MVAVSEQPPSITFGRFRVLPHRRELVADGQPVKLGGRAYDVLTALIEAHGEVVSKDALMARVWPDRVVEENALQVQISALRTALRGERELIRTVAGRGYQFTGEIRQASASIDKRSDVEPDQPLTNLPEPVSQLIGRNDELRECVNLVSEHRLVTLTGAGGIGKTRLALAAAHGVLPKFPDGVWLAEFSPLSDPGLVPTTVATAVGIEIAAGELSARGIAKALAGRRLLLVLDTCEHVIDAAAELAEAMLRASSAVRVLATSREPLKSDGEWIYPVPPLEVPSEDVEADASVEYSGVRLFLERARAVEPRFAPDQLQTAMLAAICRRLEGIPLAIELAAARAAALGIEVLAARLDDRFNLLARGRRTALPRHQTLRATLDWSYELLAAPERTVLRRLSIFAGVFSLEAAGAAASSPEIKPAQVVDALSNLMTKSLVTVEIDRTVGRYRLLDTTRAYAREKLEQSGELGGVARRHAEYCGSLFERAEWEARPTAEWLADYGRQIDNVRAALDWAFSPDGDAPTGVALAISSARLWFSLSLMGECCRYVERALLNLKRGANETLRHEMRLYATLAVALFNTKGPGTDAAKAWTDVLEIAERFHDTEYKLRALWGLWYNHISNGECQAALTLAQKYYALPPGQAGPADLLVGERMIGTSLYYLGDLANARRHLEHVLNHCTPSLRRAHMIRFQFDLPVAARGTLLRVLWLQGFPDQAVRMAEDNVENARTIDHVVSLYWALDAMCMIGLAVGDLTRAEHAIEILLERSAKNALAFWQALGHSYQGQLLIKRGDFATGVQRLRVGLDELRETRYVLRSPGLLGALARGLASMGELSEAQAVIDEALAQCERTDERWTMPELLRVRGDLLVQESNPEAVTAVEHYYQQGLQLAHRQGALLLELRCATSMARLWRRLGRSADALTLLRLVYDRFTEGFDTADLKATRAVLDEMR